MLKCRKVKSRHPENLFQYCIRVVERAFEEILNIVMINSLVLILNICSSQHQQQPYDIIIIGVKEIYQPILNAAVCRKTCWSSECLAGMRCEWCGITVCIYEYLINKKKRKIHLFYLDT